MSAQKAVKYLNKFKKARGKRLVAETIHDYQDARAQYDSGDPIPTSEVEEELNLVLESSDFKIQLNLHV
jgi:hypothetical protein